jgi:SNF2 family DNA or RNA helicase
MAADLVNARTDASVVWCNLNEEGKRLAKIIKESVEVSGEDSEEFKEKAFSDFISGNVKVLITKPKIGGFGLNLQHCCHQTYFPSHSYEQFYQSVRRCWRFGQKNPVTIDMITTDGQDGVMANLKRKSEQADKMFSKLVEMMWSELKLKRENKFTKKESLPSWL